MADEPASMRPAGNDMTRQERAADLASLGNRIADRYPDRRLSAGTTLRRCQLVMIRMLKILDEICRYHGIDYWMTSGTLIGAVRHQGFVPWDCDVDVGFTKDDLARLKRCRASFPEDIFWQDGDTDPYYPKRVMMKKLRDRHSNYVQWQQHNPDVRWHNGLQVDLIEYQSDGRGNLVNPVKRVRYRRDQVFPCTRLEFEGSLLSAPRDHDNYLRAIYGDYMTLPEPAARVSHQGRADPLTPCEHPQSRPFTGGET